MHKKVKKVFRPQKISNHKKIITVKKFQKFPAHKKTHLQVFESLSHLLKFLLLRLLFVWQELAGVKAVRETQLNHFQLSIPGFQVIHNEMIKLSWGEAGALQWVGVEEAENLEFWVGKILKLLC